MAPASDDGRRSVYLRPGDLLGRRWEDSGLVLTSGIGMPFRGRDVIRDLHGVLRDAGLGDQHFHDPRHATATLLPLAGANPRVAMDVFGHSDTGTTEGTYSHVIPQVQEEASQCLDSLRRGS